MQKQECYFCGGFVTEDDYCHGCKQYICLECDFNFPEGEHGPDAHKEIKAKEA